MLSIIATIIGLCVFSLLLVHLFGYFYLGKTLHDDVQSSLQPSQTVAIQTKPWLSFTPHQQPIKAGLIFHPGGYVDPEAYAKILRPLAETGVMCVAIPGRFRIPILNRRDAQKVMNQYPDISHWYISGHSIGGVVTNLFMCEEKNKNNKALKGIILLGSFFIDRYNLADLNLPTLSLYGTEDRMAHKFVRFDKNLPSPKQTIVIDGGNHGQFGSYTRHLHDNPALISREKQQQLTISAITEFINRTL